MCLRNRKVVYKIKYLGNKIFENKIEYLFEKQYLLKKCNICFRNRILVYKIEYLFEKKNICSFR